MKNKIRNIGLICWLLSLLLFGGLLIWMNKVDSTKPIYQNLAYFWLGDIGFGIIAFLAMLFAMANTGDRLAKNIEVSKKLTKNISLIKPFIILMLVVAIISGIGIYAQERLATELNKSSRLEGGSLNDQASENELTTAVNNWEQSQNYQPYVLDSKLCDIASARITELSKNWGNASDIRTYDSGHAFYNLAENDSKDISNEQLILNRWLSDKTTERNLKDYFKYACVKCENNLCVQILGNRSAPTTSAKQNDNTSKTTASTDNLEWGKTIKVDDITSRTRFASDDHMSSVDELNNAMNLYRQSHNLSSLRFDSLLCQIAQQRADQLYAKGEMDKHEGFKPLFDGQDSFGEMVEVLFSGNGPTSGIHVIEWGWDQSVTGHHDAISDPRWTEGCGGIAGYFAVFIFGKR